MQVGTLVKYNEKGLMLRLPIRNTSDSVIGIVVSTSLGAGGWRARVQWNNDVRRQEWFSNLEVICK